MRGSRYSTRTLIMTHRPDHQNLTFDEHYKYLNNSTINRAINVRIKVFKSLRI